MIDAARTHAPADAAPIDDAVLRIRQAASAVRSAATLAPDRAESLSRVHAALIDALVLLGDRPR